MSTDDDHNGHGKQFRDAIKNTRPLKQDKIKPYRQGRKPVPEKTLEDQQQVMDDSLSDDFELADIETGEELLFQGSGIQNTVMRKLRRGQYSVEAELDLHRKTSTEARVLLGQFLTRARQQGCRCVQIIHGKGLGSEGNVPVLKNKVNNWLRQKDEVLAFCSAIPRDGGTGAVYVLLKRM